MELQPNTKQFIDDLQKHFGRNLAFPREIGFLIDQTNERGMEQPFRDAVFHAKFVTKTREVMSRIGTGGEGFDKLSAEFQASVEKVSALLKTIVKESPDEIKQPFVKDFFSLDQTSFARFATLLEDLSWVKNWEVDGKPLPFSGRSLKMPRRLEPASPSDKRPGKQSEDLARIRNGAMFGFVLMILLFFVDPPVTFLGWGLAIVVVLLLLYIALASHTIAGKSKTPV